MRRLTAALTILAAALGVAACGEKQERTRSSAGVQHVDLVLDYLPNPDHAGIYTALRDGQFRESGLDVRPVVPPDPAAPLKLLAAGRADIAISYEPELLLARDKGLDVVAIGALVQEPLTSIMSIGHHAIRRPADLDGKKVGTAGIPYQSAYLQTIATGAKTVDVGAFWNIEGVQLQRAHKHPSIIRVDKAGVPTYNELVLVARADEVHKQGPMLRSFLQALAQAHRAVRRDPNQGVDALLAADSKLKRGDTAAQVRATLPAFFPADSNKPFGYMDPRQWQAYARWMQQHDLIKQPASPRALTNEFLPGEGL